MDDSFVIHKEEHTQQFLTHLNSLNLHIQFTTKVPNDEWLPHHFSVQETHTHGPISSLGH